MEKTLDLEVKAILESRRGDWQAIAMKADVSHSWLSKFVNGHIPNPGYATLKRLHECLTEGEQAPAPEAARARRNATLHLKRDHREPHQDAHKDKPSTHKGR